MKKLYTIILALFALTLSAQADVLATSNAAVSLGDQITSLERLKSAISAGKLFILQHHGIAKNEDSEITTAQKEKTYYSELTSTTGSTLIFTNTASLSTALVKFEVIENSDNYNIIISSGNYIAYPISSSTPTITNAKPEMGFTLSEALNASNQKIGSAFFIKGGDYYLSRKDNGGSDENRFAPEWNTEEPWNRSIDIYEAKVTYRVTWRIVDNSGNEIKTLTTAEVESGSSASTTETVPSYPFTTLSYNNTTLTSGGTLPTPTDAITDATTVDITADFSTLPFKSSTTSDYHWYYVRDITCKNNDNGYWGRIHNIGESLISTDTDPYFEMHKLSTLRSNDMWAFVGNPITGFNIVNQYYGTDDFLALEKSVSEGGKLIHSKTQQCWQIESVASVDKSFSFYILGDDNSTKYYLSDNVSDQSTTAYLKVSNTSDDNSHWYVGNEVLDAYIGNSEDGLTLYYTPVNKVYNETKDEDFGKGLGKYGYYYYNDGVNVTITEFTRDEVNKAIEAAKPYEYNYTTTDKASDQKKIDDAVNSLAYYYNYLSAGPNYPIQGTYLTISNNYNSADNSDTQYHYLIASETAGDKTSVLSTSTNGSSANAIWYYDGTGLLSYTTGYYLNLNSMVTSSATSIYIGTSAHDFTKCYLVGNGQKYITIDGNSTGSATNSTTNSVSGIYTTAMQLADVTSLPVTLNKSGDDKYYGSLYLPQAVTIPSGTDVYYVSSATNTEAILTKIDAENDGSTIVPAKTPVILVNSTGNIQATLYTGEKTLSISNKLDGSYIAKEIVSGNSADYYLGQLATDGGTKAPGLYKVNYSSAHYLVNKAYLPAQNVSSTSVSTNAKGFAFTFGDDDDPTGINSAVENGGSDVIEQNAVRYNLQGQRVPQGYKGVVIVNGKKFLVK